jgi:acyl-CoA thioester hydrolase
MVRQGGVLPQFWRCELTATFDYPVGIAPDDIDHMGHVNNAVYLRWVQAAVIAHWEHVAPAEAVARHLWIALKHEITYRRPAFLDDALCATVTIDAIQGARAMYRTLIRRGDEVMAEASSIWCCLDAGSRRPIRLARDVARRFLPLAEPDVQDAPEPGDQGLAG